MIDTLQKMANDEMWGYAIKAHALLRERHQDSLQYTEYRTRALDGHTDGITGSIALGNLTEATKDLAEITRRLEVSRASLMRYKSRMFVDDFLKRLDEQDAED